MERARQCPRKKYQHLPFDSYSSDNIQCNKDIKEVLKDYMKRYFNHECDENKEKKFLRSEYFHKNNEIDFENLRGLILYLIKRYTVPKSYYDLRTLASEFLDVEFEQY